MKDPDAMPIFLTRDEDKAQGTFVHEELSEGIFDEVNNVIDANRVLGQGQARFFLEFPVYYRIYAERFQVKQSNENIRSLFHSAMFYLNAPPAYWIKQLSDAEVASSLSALYLEAKQPHIYFLLRLAILLGPDAYAWLFRRFERKWNQHPQPPNFYWTFKQMIAKSKNQDVRITAARVGQNESFQLPGETAISLSEILKDTKVADDLLSSYCRRVFEGKHQFRSEARTLDIIAHSELVQSRASGILNALQAIVGDRPVGEAIEPQS